MLKDGSCEIRKDFKLERMQRRVTRIIKTFKDYGYNEGLENPKLTSFLESRMQSDLIEIFKIIKGFFFLL